MPLTSTLESYERFWWYTCWGTALASSHFQDSHVSGAVLRARGMVCMQRHSRLPERHFGVATRLVMSISRSKRAAQKGGSQKGYPPFLILKTLSR
jgi:hypothetical protein